ncbi:MAG: oligoribonuclease [Frankiaceae bacterium]|nr:oligoribonuclease [Frankiaceae bacterium]MDX6224972.1 oligoribonuclease [Frankiales bacterium]
MTERLVWIDCEMTGLDLVNDALVEVACLVTDADLNVLGTGVDVVIRTDPAKLDGMIDVVKEMHASSGLTDDIRAATTSMEDAEQQVLEYVKQWVPDRRKAPLCGNSIATDRAFLARDMPILDDHLHYRMVDVSSIKELARRWFPRAYFNSPQKAGGHRALADIRESILELRYYREVMFVAPPGPTTEQAQEVATRLLLENAYRPDS